MSNQHGTRYTVHVTAEDASQRLDRLLATRLPQLSRARVQALIKTGRVTANGANVLDQGLRVKPGDSIELDLPAPEAATPEPQSIPLNVVYEDDHLIVIDKPAGLVVHPAAGHASGTLVNALLAHCGSSLSGIGGVKRPGIVHRLDKDTSGLLVVAKTDAAHHGLSEQFALHGADGRLSRAYLALVWGALRDRRGIVDAPLARSRTNRTKITVRNGDDARHAVTRYEQLETFDNAQGKPLVSLVRLLLETGRTHQIRVHMAHLGHPVLGDATYGAGFAASARTLPEPARLALSALGRQALHATHLGFTHPVTQRELAFDSPPPADLQRLVDSLR